MIALDLLHAMVDTVTIESFLPTAHTVQTILNVFLSSWERSRQLASDLLIKFGAPWVSYTEVYQVLPLLNFALHLTGSVRQAESDAGALLIRCLQL